MPIVSRYCCDLPYLFQMSFESIQSVLNHKISDNKEKLSNMNKLQNRRERTCKATKVSQELH